MRYIDIVGAGSMGSALALLLRKQWGKQCYIRMIDPEETALASIPLDIADEKIFRFSLDKPIRTEFVVCAASWSVTKEIASYLVAMDYDKVLFSLSRPIENDLELLTGVLSNSKMKLVAPLGIEPGLTEILLEKALSYFDEVFSAKLYCGGIILPTPDNPLRYKRLFGREYLPFTLKPAYKIVSGILCQVSRFSDVQPYVWQGIGCLESWHDGMQKRLGLHTKLQQADVEQRTLRWSGYANVVLLLNQLGLMDEKNKDPKTKMTVKENTERAMATLLSKTEQEISKTLLSIEVRGKIKGNLKTLHLSAEFSDLSKILSSMAVATCLPVIYFMTMMDKLQIASGFYYPEELICGEHMDYLLTFLNLAGGAIKEKFVP